MRVLVSLCALLASFLVLSGCGGSASSLFGLSGDPVLTGILPNPATRGSTVTISGTNLNGTLTTAYFVMGNGSGSASAGASSGDSGSVVVTVPTTLSAGSCNVHVITSDGNGNLSTPSNVITISLN